MGRGYSGNHPRFSHRQDERYDAKEAYNKDLTASARLHYLENDRHDHDSPAHGHCTPMHRHTRSHKLRERAIKISERSGAERGDEYDYENPKVMKLLNKANKLDERSNKVIKEEAVGMPIALDASGKNVNPDKTIMKKVVTEPYFPPNDERSGEIRNEMIDEMIDDRPDSPMNRIDKMGQRILNQSLKSTLAGLAGDHKKEERHYDRAMRMKHRDDKRKARKNKRGAMSAKEAITPFNSPMAACAKSEGGSGCIKQMGGAWRVISNKTDKPWPAKYASKSKAEAALRGYHAG